MLDWTINHCRYFHRLLTSESLLYTEDWYNWAIVMAVKVTCTTNQEEHPVALRLVAQAEGLRHTQLAQQESYDEGEP